MSLHKHYNPNPLMKREGDCTVRAICKATGKSWDSVYAHLSAYGFIHKAMPSTNHIWGKYLRKLGFGRRLIEEDCTVEEFCREHPEGTYILATDGHVVCAVDGFYYDSWDSGQEVPVYYWARGD